MRKALLGVALTLWFAPAAHAAAPTRILYASDWTGHMEIFAVDPSGKRPLGQVTFGTDPGCLGILPCGFVDPILSPDGRHLLYRNSASGSLWVARADGSEPHRLVAPPAGANAYQNTFPLFGNAAWAPDSKRLAYRDSRGIHVIGADGRNDRIVDTGIAGDVGWAHGGKSLFVLDEGTGKLYSLRNGRRRLLGVSEGVRMTVSPDGHWIATTSSNAKQNVHVIHVGYRRVTQRAAGPGVSAAWSPDSRRLAIESRVGIRVFDVRTRRTRWLTKDVGFADSEELDGAGLGMAWAPDGRSIAYVMGSVYPYLFGGIVNGDLKAVTLAAKTRTVVQANELYGGRMISVAWARSPTRRYTAPEPEPTERVASDSILADGPIDRLVADGTRVAFVACDGVFVWSPTSRSEKPVKQEGPPTSCVFPINYEIYDLALADDRLVYATSNGCNSIEVTLHLERLAASASGSDLAQSFGNCGAPFHPALGKLAASGGLLVYSEWWETSDIPISEPFSITSEVIHRVDGDDCPCPTIASSPGPLYPADVDHDRVVVYGNDATLLLDREGNRLLSLPISPLAAQLAGTDLVVLVHGELRDYDTRSGALTHTWPMPDVTSGAECAWRSCTDYRLVLHDAAQGLVVYTLDGQVHLLRLADGADATVAAGTLARFMDLGLVYADGARIHLVPYAQLPLRAF